MEVAHRHAPLGPVAPSDMYGCIERVHRHRHVSRIGGDALAAGAQHGVQLGDPVDRTAAAAGLALVAGLVDIGEIETPGALTQIAAGRGLVAQLLGGAGEDRAGQHRIIGADARMHSRCSIRGERADPQSAVFRVLDLPETDVIDIRQLPRFFDLQLHQVEQVRPARDGESVFPAGDLGRFGKGAGTAILERPHARSPMTSSIAAMMFA